MILQNIMKTAQDSYTNNIEQIVRFQEKMHFEKNQLDQIQDGRLSAIIHLDRPDIGKTVKQNVRFQERMHLEKMNSIKFKLASYRPLFTLTWSLFGKPC